jgi:hypothetical protein
MKKAFRSLQPSEKICPVNEMHRVYIVSGAFTTMNLYAPPPGIVW